ncbi:MAG TPA: hypothetical protein VMJ93_10855 [Verrucomicrobiae bacterium]|nr:hypothetical protein [Verrucomicrobiae bacterium]
MKNPEFVLNPRKGQVDGWFPIGDVSLACSFSHIGKTRLVLDLLRTQREGLPFLGHKTNALPFTVIFTERNEDSHEETMECMGIGPTEFPYRFIFKQDAQTLKLIDGCIAETSPKVLLVDGLDVLCRFANSVPHVVRFMGALQHIAEKHEAAIIGTVIRPAILRGLRSDPWERLAETVMVMQPLGLNTRKLKVVLRNGPMEQFDLAFDKQGILHQKGKTN